MGVPISIRLDNEVRHELEVAAGERGIGLATLLRDLATEAACEVRRARIRAASADVAAYAASTPAARGLYEEVGAPTTDAG